MNAPARRGPVQGLLPHEAPWRPAPTPELRRDAAECRLISDLATHPAKRELFDRLSTHLGVLADQVEEVMVRGDLKSGT
jgi:hypothetical protein